MGLLQIEVMISSGSRGPTQQAVATVDPGATYSMFPASLLRSLHVEVWEHNRWFDIHGAEAHYDFGTAHLTIDGRTLPCAVIFGPEGHYVIGSTTMQTFGLRLDPANGLLVPY